MKSRHDLSWPMAVILLAFLAVTCSIAQDNVRLTVSATNPGNTPVLNFLKGEFSVQDSGKPQTIATFVGPEAKPAPPPQLQPTEFSNLPDFRETSGAIFVVFDTIHTRYVDERDARTEVLKFLGKAAQAKHAVTLGILSGKGLYIYHDYRTGSDVLLAAMAKAGLGGMKGVAATQGVNETEVNAEAARLTAFSKGDRSNATPEEQLLRSNIDMPLTMFQDVAFAAAGLPGRKSLVWVTNAVPFDIDPKTMQFKSPQVNSRGAAVGGTTGSPGSAGAPGVAVGGSKDVLTDAEKKRIAPIWRSSMRAMFDGGVAVYPVEVRGSASSATNTLTQVAMKELAILTGGKAYFGSNDPFPDILQTSNGNTAGYEIGYASDPSTNSDFRRMDVTANHQNVIINHPAGYFPYEGTPKSRAGEESGLAM